ncbi:carbonyl reductase [Actinomycetospora sp. NBRC 106375]|uniref:SDR family NAD(P)-dependent oxidoreductase n=1 Tax=Actinomycetospora sp. NBRC 106375 TaxID=3032207 RepID=UPI0024A2D37C|nr:SDR family NAD(P)-dependent oxidoreductase [Actinomycetospora sp. NBRC 106375]GLZ44829.1 carbonyl reductase [Actinomycetospora sp. NBRC 106375]
MTTSRTALVTGATQGLGLALAAGLAARLEPSDRVLLTGRDAGRVEAAVAALPARRARVEGRVLDVRDPAAITDLAGDLGEVDVVLSNATSRMSPEQDPAEEVDAVVETNNLATSRVLRAFGPRLRPGGRLVVVASALGTLDKLDVRVRERFAAAARGSLEDVDALVADWRAAVHAGRAVEEGFGTWLNIPSKVAQVAAVRAVASARRAEDLRAGRLVVALCPGLIDTAASRPWFADMSSAQTPDQAAAWPLDLVLGDEVAPFYGELVQFGRVLPWETGIPVPHRAVS